MAIYDTKKRKFWANDTAASGIPDTDHDSAVKVASDHDDGNISDKDSSDQVVPSEEKNGKFVL